MSTALATQNGTTAEVMEAVIAKGDLSKLTAEERTRYYLKTCETLGVNPTTQPFQYLSLNGKLTLYATRTATDQLRKINGVSLEVTEEVTTADGLRLVRVRATDKTGRVDEEIGAVNVGGLKGDALANAYMKAITKAKRRATLSICGLGWMDETEVETTPAVSVPVDFDTGEIIDAQAPDEQPTIDVSSWQTLIEEAEDQAELSEVADAMKLAGITSERFPDLLRAWKAKHNRLKIAARHNAPAAQAAFVDVPDGDAGKDAYTS